MEIKKQIGVSGLIKVHPPYLDIVDLKTIRNGTISWCSIGDVDTKLAREFAQEILRKCDELDSSSRGDD